MTEINTHGMVCDFGQHNGTPYTQVPVSYLRWMVNVRHKKADIAQAELSRRNTVVPDMDISGHAIDRATLITPIYHSYVITRNVNEGLHAWLVRVAREALDKKNQDDKGRYRHAGIVWVFQQDGVWPVLKTVMRDKKRGNERN